MTPAHGVMASAFSLLASRPIPRGGLLTLAPPAGWRLVPIVGRVTQPDQVLARRREMESRTNTTLLYGQRPKGYKAG